MICDLLSLPSTLIFTLQNGFEMDAFESNEFEYAMGQSSDDAAHAISGVDLIIVKYTL